MTDEKLVRAVAEEVMGWKSLGPNTVPDAYQDGDGEIYNTVELTCFHKHFFPIIDAKSWMMVVERMMELGYGIDIGNRWREWSVDLSHNTDADKSVIERDENIGRAICLAALEAVRRKP